MKIIQIYDKLDRHGGAQSVLIILDAYFVKIGRDAYISGCNSYEDLFFRETIEKNRYIHFNLSNIFKYSNSTIISHSRKLTTLFILINKYFKLQCNIIHISHSLFESKKIMTLYPKNIIAISYAVKQNLIEYFGVKEGNIEVIYNGIKEQVINKNILNYSHNETIKIVHVARIEDVKQQIEIVKELSGKLNKNIRIDFIGSGSQVEELKKVIAKQEEKNFKYLGFSSDIINLIQDYHYVMLFSKKEGLGLTLVEGCMLGKPLITKGIDGCEACAEVCTDGYNGFIVNTFDELLSRCNQLNTINQQKYNELCQNSRQVYQEKFKIDFMLDQYIKYIKKVENNEK